MTDQEEYNLYRSTLADTLATTLAHLIDNEVLPRAAFEVIERSTGKRYAVYEDGRIEGFDGDCIVLNRIPAIKADAVLDALCEASQ